MCLNRHTQNIYIIIYNYMALEKLSIKPRITIFSKTQNKISAILPQISLHLKRSKGGYTPTSGLTYTATGSASARNGQDWLPMATYTHHGQRIGSPRAGLATYGHIHRHGQEIDHLRPHTPQRAALATYGPIYAPRAAHRLATGRGLTTSGLIHRNGQHWLPMATYTHHGQRVGSPRAGD